MAMLLGVGGCVVEVDVPGAEASTAALVGEPSDDLEPRGAPMFAPDRDCHGDPLPSCSAGWTGSSCDHPCDPGAASCGLRYYCHADGRVAGLALSRAHLFGLPPDPTPLELRDQLEGWIVEHGGDLGLEDGHTAEELQLEPADGFEVRQGQLALYRFRQSYRASDEHPQVPVVGEGALLSLQVDPTGAVALTGTVIDPRGPFAHQRWQALPTQAQASIRHHASVRTGVPEADIEVDALQLVALPWAQQIAWYGVPTVGAISMGRVIVDADPQVAGVLELLMYDDGKAYALDDVEPITVQTQDVAHDPWAHPMVEAQESALANGEPLLGSSYDGHTQLASEEVVVIDMQGNAFDPSLYDHVSSTWAFTRYTEGAGFTASDPDERFGAQRLYHLVKSGYAVVDRMALGKWDSALSVHDPTLASDFPPGTYRPRIIIGYEHASTGSSGQASWFRMSQESHVLSGFPESIQRPAPGLENEIMATINVPLGLIHTDTLFHEVGHNLDLFLAPGYPDNHAPPSCPGCGSCAEDSSDEANPLTETIAQMLAMWQLVRVFPNMSHDTCNLMHHLKGGTTNNQQLVHSPGCMSSSDSLALFLRDDDPACPDVTLCDKPSNPETDATMGASHWCDATEGYNTYSVLQAWWNWLHGLYCEPPGPMGVACMPRSVTWPPGCDMPDSGVDCATSDEVAGLALLYATRSNPTSYEQLFDDMARFVSCNYGAQAYDDFNQALCDHQIRACDEPAPLSCEQCGNGIREGTEQCDGNDISVDEIGYVPSCTSLGFEGGTLACHGMMDPQPCTYDISQCTMPGLDDTGADASTEGAAGSTSYGADTDGAGANEGDENGCSCTHGGSRSNGRMLFPMVVAGLLARRRRRRAGAMLGVSLAALGSSACADAPPISAEADADASTSSANDTDSTSDSETFAVPTGWPENWHGDYHDDVDIGLGQEHHGLLLVPGGLGNLRLEPDRLTLERFGYEVDDEAESWTFATELEGAALRVLPPGGAWEILYGGAEEVLLRPGSHCDELVLEIHGLPPPHDTVVAESWLRGHLCVLDPHDRTLCCDPWIIDLCPGSTTTCPD